MEVLQERYSRRYIQSTPEDPRMDANRPNFRRVSSMEKAHFVNNAERACEDTGEIDRHIN